MTNAITERGRFRIGQLVFATYFGKGTVVSFDDRGDAVVVRWRRGGKTIHMSPHLLKPVEKTS